MSTQPINATGLEVIEHLDFDHETPCDQTGCKRGADLRILRKTCPACGREPAVWLRCYVCWGYCVEDGTFRHIPCGHWVPSRYLSVLGPVNP